MTLDSIDRGTALENYKRDGYTIFRNVIDADLIAEASAHVTWLQEKHPDVPPEELGHVYMTNDPFWIRLISDQRLVDIAELFVGPDVALFASHYINKPPFTGRSVLWHQDAARWPLDPVEVVTLWLAVDESTPENGCVRVIPGSQNTDYAPMRDVTDRENVFGAEIAVDVDETRAVNMILRPGDVEVHHPAIIHGSNANRSPKRRCGLTIRYIPTSTRITGEEQPFPSAFWLRGDRGVNAYQEPPLYVDGEHFPFRDSRAWV